MKKQRKLNKVEKQQLNKNINKRVEKITSGYKELKY